MKLLLIILGVIIYLLIGGIVNAIVNDEEVVGLLIFWPIFMFLTVVVALVDIFKTIGEMIVTVVYEYLHSQSSRKE